MTDSAIPDEAGGVGFAAAWMMALGLTLSMVPVIGPFVAGAVGGWRARKPLQALLAAVLPALFVGGSVAAFAHRGIQIKSSTLWLPPGLMASMQVAALFGGALTGARGRPAKLGGLALLIVALALFGRFYTGQIRPALNIARQAASATGAAEGGTVATCPDDLKKLYNAAMGYADDWDGKLPPADRWMSALTDPTESKLPDPGALNEPMVAQRGGKFGYAMNSAVGGKRVKDVKEAAGMPLFYDSSNLTLNAHDDVTSLPASGRHNGRNNVVYMDGHVAEK